MSNTFSAKTIGVNGLRYDFRDWLGGDGPQGLIPEPSDKMLEAYFDRVRELAKEADIDEEELDGLSDAEVAERTSEVNFGELQENMAEAIGNLCQDSPSKDDLLRLPFRIRQVFVKWLLKELNDPELQAGGTTNSRGRKNAG
jgi:hypothetical protein